MSWAAHLRKEHPTVLFRSATAFLPEGPEPIIKAKGKGKSKPPTEDGVNVDATLSLLGKWAKAKKGSKPFSVAVVGLTNVTTFNTPRFLVTDSDTLALGREKLFHQFTPAKICHACIQSSVIISGTDNDSTLSRGDHRSQRTTNTLDRHSRTQLGGG